MRLLGVRIATIDLKDIDGVDGFAVGMLNAGQDAQFVRVDFAVLRAHTSIPKHPAEREQVFFVVSGEGRVAGDDDVEYPVRAGQAVTWSRLEQHTTWADTDMAAVIVQRKPSK